MGAAAVALAREAGYVNAGTVELIAERDDPERFYFLEVNTRLQVEHPVTEAVTGLDLVELQLRVAAGEELAASARRTCGSTATRSRRALYAEDPAHGFLPSAGRVVAYREPAGAVGGPGGPAGAIRVDSGIERGTEVGTDYDPMLAKVIAHAADRGAALARLRARARRAGRARADDQRRLPARAAGAARGAGRRDGHRPDRAPRRRGRPAPAPTRRCRRSPSPLLLGPPPSDDPWDARDGWRATGPAWARARLARPPATARSRSAPPPRRVAELCAR